MPEVTLSNPEDTGSLQLSVEPPGACVPHVGPRRNNIFLTDPTPLTESATPGTFEPFPVPSLFAPGAAPPEDDTRYAITCRLGPGGADARYLLNGSSIFSGASRVFDPSGAPPAALPAAAREARMASLSLSLARDKLGVTCFGCRV